LAALLACDKPIVRAYYGYADAGTPTLTEVLDRFLDRTKDRAPA
jgi:predicted GTPase